MMGVVMALVPLLGSIGLMAGAIAHNQIDPSYATGPDHTDRQCHQFALDPAECGDIDWPASTPSRGESPKGDHGVGDCLRRHAGLAFSLFQYGLFEHDSLNTKAQP